MKRLGWLATFVGIAAAGGAWAKPLPPHKQLHHRTVAAAHVSYRHKPANHKGPAAQTRARPGSAAPARDRTLAMAQDPAGPPDHPGWFKAHDEAGWGFSQGGAQTVVGLYKRPYEPQLPGPQIYHDPEGRGAAGVSISLKLGH